MAALSTPAGDHEKPYCSGLSGASAAGDGSPPHTDENARTTPPCDLTWRVVVIIVVNE